MLAKVALTALALLVPASSAQALATLESPSIFGDIAYVSEAPDGIELDVYTASGNHFFKADEFIDADGECDATGGDGFCAADGVDEVFVGFGPGGDTLDLGGLLDAHAIVRLGPGGDEVTGSARGDTLAAGDGSDSIQAGDGADTIADAGLQGVPGGTGTGVDVFAGEGGGDTFVQGQHATADTIDGGLQRDRVDFSERTQPVAVTPEGGGPDGQAGENDQITNVEVVVGGSGGDTLTGGEAGNALIGGAGNDALHGGGGNDTLRGGTELTGAGSGDDVLDGGPGADVLIPGDGVDTLSYRSQPGGVTVALDGQAGDGHPFESAPAGFEIVEGSVGPDSLTGSPAHDDDLRGLEGGDTLAGAGGADTLDPGPGPDVADGESGDDRILARDGEVDTIACGSGTDVAVVDAQDVVGADCETVERDGGSSDTGPVTPTGEQPTGGPVGGAQQEGTPTGPGGTGATTPPVAAQPLASLRIRSRRVVADRRRRVRVKLACSSVAPCAGRLGVRAGKARGSAAFALRAGQATTVTVRLRGAARGRRAAVTATLLDGRRVAARLRLRR